MDYPRYYINKKISDQFGLTEYSAEFYSDNKTFVTCTLDIDLGVPMAFSEMYSLYYTTTVTCDPEDTFDNSVGHIKALTKCINKLENYLVRVNFGDITALDIEDLTSCKTSRKSRWNKLFDHLARINILYIATIMKVTSRDTGKTPVDADVQLLLPFDYDLCED